MKKFAEALAMDEKYVANFEESTMQAAAIARCCWGRRPPRQAASVAIASTVLAAMRAAERNER